MRVRELYELLKNGIPELVLQNIQSQPLEGFERTVASFLWELQTISRIVWEGKTLWLDQAKPEHHPMLPDEMLSLQPGDLLVITPGVPFCNCRHTSASVVRVERIQDFKVICDLDTVLATGSATHVVKVGHES